MRLFTQNLSTANLFISKVKERKTAIKNNWHERNTAVERQPTSQSCHKAKIKPVIGYTRVPHINYSNPWDKINISPCHPTDLIPRQTRF